MLSRNIRILFHLWGYYLFFRFKSFLRAYKDPITRKVKYIDAIKQMVADNRESLEVDYNDLAHETGEQNICYFLPEAPSEVSVL